MRRWGGAGLVEAGMGPPSPIRTGHPNVFTFYFKALDSGPERRPGPRCQPGRVAAATVRPCHLPLVPPPSGATLHLTSVPMRLSHR